MDFELAKQISIEGNSKLLLFVMDGLGGLPNPKSGRTELETARTPNLDQLAAQSACGFTIPVAPAVTPGSGPGHLALFGYDPLAYNIGRGVLEATGIDFDLQLSDIAARGNFCSLDDDVITDRRAGRISTKLCVELCRKLSDIELPNVDLFVEPVREHRLVLILRGSGLSEDIWGTDPLGEGSPPLAARASSESGEWTAGLVNRFCEEARKRLSGDSPANMVLFRGFAKRPDWPTIGSIFKLRAAAVAHYPMYRGLARLVGMTTLTTGPTLGDSLATLRENWDDYDYFFAHYKATDKAGEDGDFTGKVAAIEEVDAIIPAMLDLEPDVLMIAGDHSTPAIMAAHSWHPVPFLMKAKHGRADAVAAFNEGEMAKGSLGVFPAMEALPLAMAHAGRLVKYGA